MSRAAAFAAAVTLAVPAAAPAQPIRATGFAPRVGPALLPPAPFVPGRPQLPARPPGVPVYGFYPAFGPGGYGGYGFGGYGYGGYGYGGYGFGGYSGLTYAAANPAPAAPPPALVGTAPTVSLDQVSVTDSPAAAELTIDFPAEVELRTNGKVEAGTGKTRTVTTPDLRLGDTATVNVEATWTQDGEKYEWDRTVTLGRGERGRLTVARGFKVK